MRSILACALAAVLVPAAGCKDEQSDALPPPSGGGAASGPIAVRDAGPRPPRPGGDEDGGGGGAGSEGDSGVLPGECRGVDVVQLSTEEVPAGTEASTAAPADFPVSRLVGTWQGGCEEPVFLVELSDGSCPSGRGHALSFMIDGAALRDGSLRLGLNTITPEPNDVGVRVRYVRPERLSPAGEWGTCAGATGLIDLLGEAPSTAARSTLQATFALELTACDGSDELAQTVDGTFDVRLERGLDDYCPEL